jgi:DNA-binding CsgD family transcriptional regulator
VHRRVPEHDGSPLNDWWKDVEDDVLRCLAGHGALSPATVAAQLGVSEATVTSWIAMMAQEGKVRICAVSMAHRAAAPGVAAPPRRGRRRGIGA